MDLRPNQRGIIKKLCTGELIRQDDVMPAVAAADYKKYRLLTPELTCFYMFSWMIVL